jgi:hypothetical protein
MEKHRGYTHFRPKTELEERRIAATLDLYLGVILLSAYWSAWRKYSRT